jgi:ribosomal protein S15P/S13E
MNIDFPPPSTGIYNNAGSCRRLANYLEHEDLERMQKGIYTEGFFNLKDDNLYKAQVIKEIDSNIGQLLKTDAKFYAMHVSPSEKELKMMGQTEQEQAKAMKRYIREVFIPEYAKNFNKGLSAEDIKFYGKIHFDRDRSDNEMNMHCHLIVSRKDQSNKVKISPLTNHRNTKKGAIKGGFHRTAFFENAEKGFDRLFGYNRQLPETFEYCNTMKNGSITEKLQMQEREIHQQSEKKRDIAPNKHILKPDFSTRQQQASASINHSNTIDAVASLFSILPSAADIAFSNNPEDEQPLRRPKKKKKGRRIGQ